MNWTVVLTRFRCRSSTCAYHGSLPRIVIYRSRREACVGGRPCHGGQAGCCTPRIAAGAAPVDRVPPLATPDRSPYRIWRNVDQIGSGSRPACKNCHRRRCGAPMTASCGPMQLQLLMLQKLALLWRDMYRIKHVVKMPLLTHRYLSCQSTVTGVSNETNNSARNNGLTE